ARIRRVLQSDVLQESTLPSLPARLRSWITTHPGWWAKATHGDRTDIDVVLEAVGTDPQAAGILADRTEFVAPLLYGTHDTAAVRRFWMMVTDPSTTAPEVAGRRIRAVLEAVFGDHDWSQRPSPTSIDAVERRRIETAVRDMLGAIVAPWQFAFTGRAALWSWSTEIGVEWLRRVSESARAAADLSRGLGPAVIDALSNLPADSLERRRVIDDVAVGIGASLKILEDAGIDDTGRDESSWHTFDHLVELVPMNAPWPVSILVDRGASWLDDRLATRPTNVDHDVALTGHQVLAGLAVLTVWRSYWSHPSRVRSPAEQDRELRHTYDAIDSPSARGRIIASER
ncbi:MAG: hypothetical protein ACO3SP_08705, partial [Ilumatobacteraceae bacterium]